jgi:hypothetical protein
MIRSRSLLAKPAWAIVVAALWLAGCATAPDPGSQPVVDAQMLQAIRAYYEHNATEQGNICRGPIMEGVTRTELVSQDAGERVIRVSYRYSNYINRSRTRNHCTGSAKRTFTLAPSGGRYRVVAMSGEVRTGPTLRIW